MAKKKEPTKKELIAKAKSLKIEFKESWNKSKILKAIKSVVKKANPDPENQVSEPVSAEIKAKLSRKWRNSPCPKCGETPCVTEQATRYKATLRCRSCKHRFEVVR